MKTILQLVKNEIIAGIKHNLRKFTWPWNCINQILNQNKREIFRGKSILVLFLYVQQQKLQFLTYFVRVVLCLAREKQFET